MSILPAALPLSSAVAKSDCRSSSGRRSYNETNTAETITCPKATPQTPPALVKKIGKNTYRVWAHFSTTSIETMEDKIKRLLREEIRQAMENE